MTIKNLNGISVFYQKGCDCRDANRLLPVVISQKFRIELNYIGEGLSGDFGEVENDIPCMRFDVSLPLSSPEKEFTKEELVSYCFPFSADSTPSEMLKRLHAMIDYLESHVSNIDEFDIVCQDMTRMSTEELEKAK